MVTENDTPRTPEKANADAERLRAAATREASSARTESAKIGSTVTEEASHLASEVREKAYEGAEAGKSYAASSLNDFTAAIKKASEELGERDQSMAASLVREAASGLEQVSGAIEGKSIQELTHSVAGFARRQPAAFLIGAALAGVALGRFAKASSEHDERAYVRGEERSSERSRSEGPPSSPRSSTASGAREQHPSQSTGEDRKDATGAS